MRRPIAWLDNILQPQMLDPTYIRDSLRRLARVRPNVFGAGEHEFKLNPPLSEAEVAAFEAKHGIRLPGDYRQFIAEIANGGPGPYYGVFPLGYMDGTSGAVVPWDQPCTIVGDLAAEFPHREAWNDLTGRPPDELAGQNEPEYERQIAVFEARYFAPSVMNGALPICHMGCALRVWLVVTGEQRGHLWRDGRAEDTGVSPILLKDGSPAEFSGWYRKWMEEAFGLLKG
jgi:SMI1/KNR4 family protein SUKH-1